MNRIRFSLSLSLRLKEHIQMNNDPRIRNLLIENLMKSGGNEDMLQQFVRNYPYEYFFVYIFPHNFIYLFEKNMSFRTT